MNKQMMAGLMLVLMSATSLAAEKTGAVTEKSAVAGKPAKAAKIVKPAGKTSTDVDVKDGLDIIGSQDAPLELNIVPWKDKDNVLPKNPLEASMLKEVLEPIDRDVVRREVDFSRAIQTFPTPSP
ncbi:MAG: hypothetical protein Q7T36_09795 [Fluviicoccus sp.]|uniref:hypothetical protein n=1 Tax=Fluviicoccus sp. TaxID=2003552 RepID=UPI00271E03AA|nr:hypothetical protein [Fluviicoccus sp.]MDO8330748.1 hypothetical protein [Fluviicoccus sp.]